MATIGFWRSSSPSPIVVLPHLFGTILGYFPHPVHLIRESSQLSFCLTSPEYTFFLNCLRYGVDRRSKERQLISNLQGMSPCPLTADRSALQVGEAANARKLGGPELLREGSCSCSRSACSSCCALSMIHLPSCTFDDRMYVFYTRDLLSTP
ncbi:hypothetical protein VTK26DRAFT_3695 [Humicola hyalothermophila]